MYKLKFVNIMYDKNNLDEKIIFKLQERTNNLIEFKSDEELISILKSKEIHLVIIQNNLNLIKEIRKINKQIQIISVVEELKEEYLFQSLEIKNIKFSEKIDSKDRFKELFRECLEHVDSNDTNILQFQNNFAFDVYTDTLFRNNEIVSLSNKEIQFFSLLIKNKNKNLTYDEIATSIWDGKMSQDALRTIVKELRKKTFKELIKNVSGVGYRLDNII